MAEHTVPVYKTIRALLEGKKYQTLKDVLGTMNPSDLAAVFEELDKDRIPLLCRGNEVIMAAGVGTGAVPRWKPEENNIRLEWTGDLPWTERKGEPGK